MNRRTRTLSRSRRTMTPALDQLEARQLLAVQSLVLVPSPMVARSELFGAAAIASNDMWAVGYTAGYGAVHRRALTEHFDGTSWSVVPNSLPGDPLFSVAAAASNDVWAVGTPPYIAHWNGTSWSVVASPTLPPNSSLSAVTAPAANNAWVVGTTSGSSNAVVEHWNGKRWSLVSSPAFTGASDILRGIAAVSAKSIFAVGSAIEHWNGHKWSLLTTPSGVSGMDGVTALSDGTVVIVTSGGAILEN